MEILQECLAMYSHVRALPYHHMSPLRIFMPQGTKPLLFAKGFNKF